MLKMKWSAIVAILVFIIIQSGALWAGEDVVIDAPGESFVGEAKGFTEVDCPFVLDKKYLQAEGEGVIRHKVPAGKYYVYIAWARHPEGAKDVVVKLKGKQWQIDQSKLANGIEPEKVTSNDMKKFTGVCSSGLYRLTDKPMELAEGDEFFEKLVEIKHRKL